MQRDRGPKYNLGFGMPLQEDVQQGEGNSSFIQKALDGHPVMRFFAVAGASIVAMGVAGKVVREGGIRFAFRAQELAKDAGKAGEASYKGIMAFRKIESLMDSLEGLNRVYADPNDLSILVKKEGAKLVRDKTTILDNFEQRFESDSLQAWSNRDTIQQKLVSQARRLPYEATGLYAAQKAVIDPITGANKDPKNKVNWGNPFDVIGDFSYQTMKNLMLNVAPFELGSGVLKNSYQTYAAQAMSRPGNAQFAFLSTKTMLGQMGVDFTDLMDRTIKLSHQSIGAFHGMLQGATENSHSFVEFIRSRQNAVITQSPEYANSGYAQKLFSQARDVIYNKSSRTQLIDTLPSPFKGMGSGISRAAESFTRKGEIYSTYQDIISGKTTFSQLRQKDFNTYQAVRSFMAKGGGTHLEQLASASFDLGKGGLFLPDGSANPDWTSGGFYKKRSQYIYKEIFMDELQRTHGLNPESALEFVRMSDQISPLAGTRTAKPEQLFERFKFTSKQFQGSLDASANNSQAWWDTLVSGAGAHNINLNHLQDGKGTFETFKKAVRTADQRFGSTGFKREMKDHLKREWEMVHGQLITPRATESLTRDRKPFDLFAGANLAGQKDYLLQRAASRLGIATVDSAGNAIPSSIIGDQLRTRGFDPANLKKIRGFLVEKKEIAAPWHTNGENLFGFKALNLHQAIQNQYFGDDRDLNREIKRLAGDKTDDIKVNKVFVGRNGKVIDFGRLGRSFVSGFDRLQDDIQVPLLKIKPAQMAGWSSFKAMRNSPAILMESGLTAQPIARAAGEGFEKPDFFLYMKTSTKATKGKVIGISSKIGSSITSTEYDGLYRPFTTNVENMLGRYGNILMGKKDIPSSQTHKQGWKRLFDLSHDQENSLFIGKNSVVNRWYRGFSGDPQALRNPYAAAQKLGEEAFQPNQLTADLSSGMDRLRTTGRGYGFSSRALNYLAEETPFKKAFNIRLGSAGEVNMLTIEDHVLPKVMKRVVESDLEALKKVEGADINALTRTQQNLRNLLTQGDQQRDFWGLKAPSSVKMSGINRRIDQLKNEAFDYLLTRAEPLGLTSAGSFDDTTQSLINHLEEMFDKGIISATEKAEGRAAILSLNMEQARNATYEVGMLPISHNEATLTRLFGRKENKELLAEMGSGKTQQPKTKSYLRRKAINFLRQEPYERPDQVNPTGASHIFMPTFGTTFARNPIRALAGVAGFSWRDPKAMSGAQIPITHLAVRLNKYFENFGIGLDETRYRSPVDFYARGIIGKRVLPLYAAGATALTIDRTIGGVTHKDKNGDRIYAPYFLGKIGSIVAAGQVGMAGLVPGGQTGREKRLELDSGEVPVRKGRYWLLGNTPFKGGRIQYFRPSWLQRLKSGSSFTPEMHETPLEKLLTGYDFSPLKPFDAYRRERQDYQTRPYPITGDYFTGPWGPLTSVLNATIGRILKPQIRMHTSETRYGLGQYQPVGEAGAYFPSGPPTSGGYGSSLALSSINSGYASAGIGTPSSGPFNSAMGYSNARGPASSMVRQSASNVNNAYSSLASPYGVPTPSGSMSPRVIPGTSPLDYGSLNIASRRLGYQSQELFGIYGFAGASLREKTGFGTKDFAPNQAILEPSSRGYGASRSFWNLNIGGLGDLPLPVEGKFSNLEISEIVRRFVPKEPAGTTYVNNIPNQMGKQFPWLPGTDYPLANLKSGDPYNTIPEGEIRLPGTGYARTHDLYPDQYGPLGIANIHDILGDVAPWSAEYKAVDDLTKTSYLSNEARAKVVQTEAQVEAMRYKNEFTPYKYKYTTAEQDFTNPKKFAIGKLWEWTTHRDTYLNTKLGAPRTAVEDWERNDVYGSTFPSWENPIGSFLKPAVYKSTQRNPFAAAAGGAALGYLFGAGNEAQAIGSVVGGLAMSAASIYGTAYEGLTGKRYIPIDRKKQAAVEEYADIFEYLRSSRAAHQAQIAGDQQTASFYQSQASSTMYGMDFNKSTPEQLAMAIPKRKREHFRAMLYAPQEEHAQILSTAPRLERRMFEAAWGMPVEDKPDLREYFQDHELPPPDSEIWTSGISQDNLKIKMGQSLGLDLAQMGYYPQQIQEANLLNPVYPSLNKKSGFSIKAQLKRYLSNNRINGDVFASPSPRPGNRLQLNAGSY